MPQPQTKMIEFDRHAAKPLFQGPSEPAGASPHEIPLHRRGVAELMAALGPRDLRETGLAPQIAIMHGVAMASLRHAPPPRPDGDGPSRHRGVKDAPHAT